MAFELTNILEAMLPDILSGEVRRQLLPFQQFGMDAYDQHFLIMGPVENADVAAFRQGVVDPPQEMVGKLLSAGRLEVMDFTAQRIYAGHHVLDDAVLARRIHALKHDEHRPS